MERNIYRDLKSSYESLLDFHNKELKDITNTILALDKEYLLKNIDINNIDGNNSIILFTKNGIDTSLIKNLQFVIAKYDYEYIILFI